MEELLKDVLIKESAGFDRVMIIDNLPKSLLYKRVKKMIIDYTDPQGRQNLVPDFEVMDNGVKRRTNATEDQLLPGIERSDSGDNAYVFYTDYNEARERLAAIDRYIASVVPVAERLPERVNYAAQPGLMSSAPLARHQIPRVVLPELVSPPAVEAAQVPTPRALGEGHIPQAPADRQIPDPAKPVDRMAKARAAKAAKAK